MIDERINYVGPQRSRPEFDRRKHCLARQSRMFSDERFHGFPGTDPLVNATVLSLLVNTAAFILGSLTRNPRPLERIQAGIFVKRHSRSQFATRGWKTRISVGDLKTAIARYLGEERMQRSFNTYERTAGRRLEDDQPASRPQHAMELADAGRRVGRHPPQF